MLLYSREGARPEGYSRDDHLLSPKGSASSSVSEEPMEEVENPPTLANVDDRDARQPILSAQSDSDLLMDADEGAPIDWKPSPQQGNADLIMQDQQEEVASSASKSPVVPEKRRMPPAVGPKPEALVQANTEGSSADKKATS